MARKPSNLIYGLDDKPSVTTLIFLGLQHSSIIFISMIFPVLIIRTLGNGIDPASALGFISLSMVAAGLTTILQAMKKGALGSGYLCPSLCGPSYISASLLAASTGGLHLLFGMTAFVGAVEMFISRFMHKLRFLFPSEVTGTVVALVGIVVIPLAIKNLVGIGAEDAEITAPEVWTGLLTLIILIALNVFGGKKLRLYTVLIGMVIGYIIAAFFGIIPREDIQKLLHSSWFSIPYIRHMGWAFDASLIIPFIVATICSTLKTVGDLVTCQKINDADWKRPDMKSVSSGIFVDGLGGLIPGVIGGFGQSTSSANVGLSIASGATSKRIAISLGFILIFLAFFPKLAGIFMIMPKPVMGAMLIFTVCFMIMAGLQILLSRMLDTRKIFVAGISIIFGLSADILPEIYQNTHPWISPVFASSLSLGTMTAMLLNLLLRIGINKPAKLTIDSPDHYQDIIYEFYEKQGGKWGARKEVVFKVITATTELTSAIYDSGLTNGKIEIQSVFNEENLKVTVKYKGRPVELALIKPSMEELINDEKAYLKLAGYLTRQSADQTEVVQKDNICTVHLHFNH
jgi:xanthine permease XanP